MTTAVHAPMFRPLSGALALGAGVLAGGAAGWGVSVAGGPAPIGSALLALGVWGFATIFGFTALLLLTRGYVDRLGMGVLGASGVRLLTALLLGVTVQVAVAPAGGAFWFTFLGAGVGALAGETAWAVLALRSLRDARTGDTSGAMGALR